MPVRHARMRHADLDDNAAIVLQRLNIDPCELQGNHVSNCPFCGVIADAPHETQEACIAALTVEIARMRELIDRVHPVEVPELKENAPDADVWRQGV